MLDSRLNEVAQITKIILRAKTRLEMALTEDMSQVSHDLLMHAIDDLNFTRKNLDVLFYSISLTVEAPKESHTDGQ